MRIQDKVADRRLETYRQVGTYIFGDAHFDSCHALFRKFL